MVTAYNSNINIIKERVTVPAALEQYGYTVKPRIPCPIHGGKGDNFEVKDQTYMCYSQCGGGDVINLVQALFKLSAAEACKKLDEDFALGLYSKKTQRERRNIDRKGKQIEEAKAKQKAVRDDAVAAYERAQDEFIRLDNNRTMYAPKSADEPLNPLFTEAINNLDGARYEMDEAEAHLREVEKQKLPVQISHDEDIKTEDGKLTVKSLALSLNINGYNCDETGVYKVDSEGRESLICPHPVIVAETTKNIETEAEKMTIAFKKDGFNSWRKLAVQRSVVGSSSKFIELSDFGLTIHSENAKKLATYLFNVETNNTRTIPQKKSVSRLGWVKGDLFSPYCDDLEFDGEMSYGALWDAVKPSGEFGVWLSSMNELRKNKSPARFFLASAFASVLLKIFGQNPFFMHVWGGTGGGKTVGLKVAASVWGNPDKYLTTFKSTEVGMERYAGFFNSLPLCIDELQIQASAGINDFDKLIYFLTEGRGKVRGKKDGGTQDVPTWHNCFITTGEHPINHSSSGGGAVNRVIELEMLEPLCTDFPKLCEIITENYGHAGALFVENLLKNGNMDYAKELQKAYYKSLQEQGVTDKQIMSASAILTADTLATEWIFKDGDMLKIEDVLPHLKTTADVSAGLRAYNFLLDHINANRSRFGGRDANMNFVPPLGECWGEIRDNEGICYFIPAILERELSRAGFERKSFLSWAKAQNLIIPNGDHFTNVKRVDNRLVRYIFLKMTQQQG